jgi:hypothetical protein
VKLKSLLLQVQNMTMWSLLLIFGQICVEGREGLPNVYCCATVQLQTFKPPHLLAFIAAIQSTETDRTYFRLQS